MNLELRSIEGFHDAPLAVPPLVRPCAIARKMVNFDSKGKP